MNTVKKTAEMERNRESRRGTPISGSFSSSRRRSRGNSVFREPSGELEDERSDSLRDRTNGKKERPCRRRRLSSSENFHVDRDEIADGSSDESMDDDHDEEDEPVRGGSSSRRTTNRAKTQYKGSDEIIGVSVPRRARSASAKRLQDSFSGIRQSSSSSPARAASVSPPSSNTSTKAGKRTKHLPTKSRHPKTSKVSISESEVEVAQFLYGLTRLQSHQSPAKPEIFQISSSKRESNKHNSSNEGSVSVVSKASSAVSTPVSTPPLPHSVSLSQKFSSVPASTEIAPKRKKPRPVMEENGKPAIAPCSAKPSGSFAGNSINSVAASAAMKIEANNDIHAMKPQVLSPKSDENTLPIISGSSRPDTPLPVYSPLQNSVPKELEELSCPSSLEPESLVSLETKLNSTDVPLTVSNGALDANSLVPAAQREQIKHKDSSSSSQDLVVLSAQDIKPETPKIASPDSAVSEGRKGARLEIDLMAPPGNSCADDSMLDADDNAPHISSDNPNPANGQTVSKKQEIASLAEKVETEEVWEGRIQDSEEKVQMKQVVEAAASERHPDNEEKGESRHDINNLDNGASKKNQQKLSRSTARQTESTAPPVTMTPTSVPATIPGWPSGLPPFGYMGSIPANHSGVPSLQGAIPMEGNAAMPNPPFVMLPQARPNRCATHCYIARLIYYQQQLPKLNPFWHAASSAAFYGAKPRNLNILPQSDAMHYGGSVMRNPNLLPNNVLGSATAVAVDVHSMKEKSSSAAADAQRKQPAVPQSLQQGDAFGSSVNQSRTGGTKPGSIAENLGIQTAYSGGSAAAAASMNPNFSNVGATSDPHYLAMLQSSYPFPIPPAYRAHLNQQQQPGPPFFNGPFIPSQFLQLQSHSVPQTQNPTTSTGSSSPQKCLQAQHGFPAMKPLSESRRSEPETTGVGEDGADSQASLAQKKLSHSFPTNPSFLPNFAQNFAMMAASLGGKQQQAIDRSLQTTLKGMEVKGTVPPGHPMFQNFPDIGHYHYQLADHQQVHAANQSKALAKASNTNKTPDPSHSQSVVTAVQHVQKQAMARTKPASSVVSTPVTSAGMAYSDRMPGAYPNGSNFPASSMGFPKMQSVQWRMPASQRMPQANPSVDATIESPVTAATGAAQGSGSLVGKSAAKMPQSTVNSKKMMPAGQPVSSQSSQAQSLSKAQQLFFPNSEPAQPNSSSTPSMQKRTADSNSAVQTMFPGSLNMRRPANQLTQPGSPGVTVAGASAYLVGCSKGVPIYSPLGGNPVAVVAAASYAQSASNMPVKSAEQKPATA